MEEKNKLSEIENYLKGLFPGCIIENRWDSKSHRHLFRVKASAGGTKHTVAVSSEFVRDNDLEDIVPLLKISNLKGYLEMFGNKEVLVTNDGINPEGIRPSLLA